jgi:asparagine synthase (glutamine-hydrolysing)
MVELMRHESFYVTGFHHEPGMNLRLGWAVHENSFSDCMPVMSDRRDLLLVFYGEHFSRSKTPGSGDARHILDLYRSKGESFLTELNGWFTGVLVDLNERKTVLFNDRFGMQRLYYHESQDAFFFCSEAKSILHASPATRAIDPEGLAQFVAFDCTLGGKSLFKDISILPGGSCWTFGRSVTCRKERYYNPEILESLEPIASEQVLGRLQDTLRQAMPPYLEASQEVAVSLTGGLDTRLIVAALPAVRGLRSYTFAGDRDTFDVRKSRSVSSVSGMQHQVIRLEREFFEGFPKLAEETVYMSDGTLGLTGTHNIYFNRLAREVAPVRLTGQFGSEVIRQGRILSDALSADGLFEKEFAQKVGEARQSVGPYRAGHPLTAALHRDIPWRGHGTMTIEQSQVTLRSPFMDNDLVDLMYRVPNALRRGNATQQELIRRFNVDLARIISDRGDASDRSAVTLSAARLLFWILFKADYVYFFDMRNWMLKMESTAAALGLTQLVFGFQKFENYRLWLRTGLSGYIRDVLLDRRTLSRGFFDPAFIRRAVADHIEGRGNYRNHLDKAMTLELIMRTLIESPLPSKSTRPVDLASVPNA